MRDLRPGQNLAYLQVHVGRRGLGDLQFLVRLGVADADVEHEAVELRLGQRIGALLLDGVLRGQHEERPRQIVGSAADRHLQFLHRLQQGGLRLGRRAVDLVGQQDVGEHRPLDEAELPRAGGAVLLDDLAAGDVRRHQVRRELDAIELQVDGLRDGADHQRLGQARHADHQAVAAREQGREQIIDDVLLPDDDAGDLLLEFLARFAEAGDRLQVASPTRPALP